MTIAAGLMYNGGVLLCTDSEHTAWSYRTHSPKIVRFGGPGGSVAMAYAGDDTFSMSAMDKCRHLVQTFDSTNSIIEELEGTLEEEYRRHVLNHPDHAVDATLDYRLLVAVWTKHYPNTQLFVTSRTAMREVPDTYECIGSGDYLGHYIIEPYFDRWMNERDVLSLAAIMLASAKGYVPGCGGVSCFLALRNDGSLHEVYAHSGPTTPKTTLEWLENSSKYYQSLATGLYFKAATPELSDSEFDIRLGNFCRLVREMRQRWRSNIVHESFAHQNPAPNPAAQPTQSVPTDDQQPPQPSPDSPEGSGES